MLDKVDACIYKPSGKSLFEKAGEEAAFIYIESAVAAGIGCLNREDSGVNTALPKCGEDWQQASED
jgi:hypothetical protein